MPNVDAHQPGAPCWLELASTDPASAKSFYQDLLGWSYFETPMGPDLPPYNLARVQDRDAAAIYSMMKEQRDMGMPSFWLAYVAVASVDEAAPRIKSLGGSVMSGPIDVPEAGRMAVAQDPAGGTFAIWQATTHPGFRIVNEPGAMCWVELLAKEMTKTEKFYASLFGWTTEKMSMGGPLEYVVFKNRDIPVAGMMLNPAGADANVPQNWIGYFQVADTDGVTDKGKARGGQVLVSPQHIPTIGKFAILADPQGAVFGILQPEPRK